MEQEIYDRMRKAFSFTSRLFSLKFKDFSIAKTFAYNMDLMDNVVSKNALASTPTLSIKEKLALPPKGEDLNKGIDLSYSEVSAKSALSCHLLLRRCWEWVWAGLAWVA